VFAYKQSWNVSFLALRNHYGTSVMHAQVRTSASNNVYISD